MSVCTHILFFSSRCFKYSHSCHFFPLWILILGIGLAGSLPPQSGLIAASSSSVSLSFSLAVLGWYSVKEFSLEKNNTVTFQFSDIPFFVSFLSTNIILRLFSDNLVSFSLLFPMSNHVIIMRFLFCFPFPYSLIRIQARDFPIQCRFDFRNKSDNRHMKEYASDQSRILVVDSSHFFWPLVNESSRRQINSL